MAAHCLGLHVLKLIYLARAFCDQSSFAITVAQSASRRAASKRTRFRGLLTKPSRASELRSLTFQAELLQPVFSEPTVASRRFIVACINAGLVAARL